MKKLTATLLIGLAFGVSQIAQAQTTVEKGKSISIEIPVQADTACNIEVVRGGEKTDVRVESNKKGVYQFAGRELGEETIRWEGKMKFRGLKTLGPCSGEGSIKVVTTESAEAIEAAKQVQKAEEEAKQAKAAMEAQATRLAELEAKLKAAEAEAAKTPEQKSEEARVAAEAKAYAAAKLAEELKEAKEAEVRAASEARAEAKARAVEEARAASEARAEAKARAVEEARAGAKAQAEAKARAIEEAKAAASAQWKKFPSVCEPLSRKGQVFALKFYEFYMGDVSATKISIGARGKVLCVSGVTGTGKSDVGNTTIVEFENGGITCKQTTDAARLATESIRRTGYKVAGNFVNVVGRRITLSDCVIEKL